MWILILAAVLIPLTYIGFLLSRLDLFLDKSRNASDQPAMIEVAVIMGDREPAAQLTELLKSKKMKVITISEPNLTEQLRSCDYLFALSEKDADNVVLCKIGLIVYGIKNAVGVCNDRINENMFRSENIHYCTSDGITAQKLYQMSVHISEMQK